MSIEKQTNNEHYERLETRVNRHLREEVGKYALVLAAGGLLIGANLIGLHGGIDKDHRAEAIGFDADMTISEIAEVGVNMSMGDEELDDEEAPGNLAPVNPPEEKLLSISGIDSPIPTTHVDIEATHSIDGQRFHMKS